MTASEVVRFTTPETAKLIRSALRAAWPGVKFSVRSRSYAGGSSIDISWADGPTSTQVDDLGRLFQGARFDPMQDLKTFVDSVAIIDGEPTEVHYSPHHVFAHRSRSPELIARLEILASLNWHNGRGDGNQCGRCYSPLPDDCWFSPSAQRLVCSPECWALAEHWHHDYTAQ